MFMSPVFINARRNVPRSAGDNVQLKRIKRGSGLSQPEYCRQKSWLYPLLKGDLCKTPPFAQMSADASLRVGVRLKF